jgi:hypothetical protein
MLERPIDRQGLGLLRGVVEQAEGERDVAFRHLPVVSIRHVAVRRMATQRLERQHHGQRIEPGPVRAVRVVAPSPPHTVDVLRRDERELGEHRLRSVCRYPGAPVRLDGERRGGVGADHRHAVGAIVDPQRETQPAVGQHAVADHPGRPLRAQHEVHAERPAARGDVGEEGVELRIAAHHRRELVDPGSSASMDFAPPAAR